MGTFRKSSLRVRYIVFLLPTEEALLTSLTIASMTGVGGWEDAMDRARDFVAELTLEEKSMMVTGQPGPCVGNILPIPRLNFTGLCLQDGPSSVRQSDFASVFPAGVTTVSSWDRELIYKRFRAMGREYRAKGSHIALA